MPNRNFLIEKQIVMIEMQSKALDEQDAVINNQKRMILDLEQQVKRWEIMEQMRNEEVYRKEGSI